MSITTTDHNGTHATEAPALPETTVDDSQAILVALQTRPRSTGTALGGIPAADGTRPTEGPRPGDRQGRVAGDLGEALHRALTEPAVGRHRRLALAVEGERTRDLAAEVREVRDHLVATLHNAGGMAQLILAGVVAQVDDLIDVLDTETPLDLWPTAPIAAGE